MKCVVTGGAGFIGSHLASLLIEEGHEVAIVDDLSTGSADRIPLKARFFKGSILDRELLDLAFRNSKYVFHLAAIASVPLSVKDPIGCSKVNIDGTLNVLMSAKENRVKRVIFASSAAVYGDTDMMPVSENVKLMPGSPYAASKLAGEIYCRAFSRLHGLDTACLRYFNVYGPGQSYSPYAGVITLFSRQIALGKRPTILGDGKQTRDFINVKDVARANLLAMKAKKLEGEAMNIASGNETSLNELCRTMTSLKPAYGKARPGDIRKSYADVRKAKKLLGFTARISLEKGLGKP